MGSGTGDDQLPTSGTGVELLGTRGLAFDGKTAIGFMVIVWPVVFLIVAGAIYLLFLHG